MFKDSKLFICVEVQKSVQQQLESRQETMENTHGEVEKWNLGKKKFILCDFFAGFSQGELSRNNLAENRVQSAGITAAIHKPLLYGFFKGDRKEDRTRQQALQGISSEPRNQECGLKKVMLTT